MLSRKNILLKYLNMKKTLLTIFLTAFGLALIFSSCKRKEENPIPVVNAPIAQERLIIVLADMHKAESIINSVAEITKRDSVAQALYSKICAIHKTTQTEIDSSLNMYLNQPCAAQHLYEEVAARLSVEENEFKSQMTQPAPPAQNPIAPPPPPPILPSAK